MSQGQSKVLQIYADAIASTSTNDNELTEKIKLEEVRNREFMAEYERYKTNKRLLGVIQLTPDAYPLMLELFAACKSHLMSLQVEIIQRQQYQISFSYLGRSWRIVFLHEGKLRLNEVHLAICHDEPNPTPFAVIGGFRVPQSWGSFLE
ncbi:hypothetical protein H8K32_19875 [Undibacterium jejuense]|uniref:Uncharacterized protein n=1 Tax=Undibacterium jejuense TaxID=1344949 RepID=A0A923KMN4_9BURK|nr:hypothetical protein [Undibacterium jejuense]MBC3864360.1 hypothetical protein [Undibacterium jejuense]